MDGMDGRRVCNVAQCGLYCVEWNLVQQQDRAQHGKGGKMSHQWGEGGRAVCQ